MFFSFVSTPSLAIYLQNVTLAFRFLEPLQIRNKLTVHCLQFLSRKGLATFKGAGKNEDIYKGCEKV